MKNIKIEIIQLDSGAWAVFWADEQDATFETRDEAIAFVWNLLGNYYLET